MSRQPTVEDELLDPHEEPWPAALRHVRLYAQSPIIAISLPAEAAAAVSTRATARVRKYGPWRPSWSAQADAKRGHALAHRCGHQTRTRLRVGCRSKTDTLGLRSQRLRQRSERPLLVSRVAFN